MTSVVLLFFQIPDLSSTEHFTDTVRSGTIVHFPDKHPT